MRIRILLRLQERPYNTNQLATDLGHDYKTIQHHIRVLLRNRVIEEQGRGQYGSVFFLSPAMEESLDDLEAIAAKMAPTPAAGATTEATE